MTESGKKGKDKKDKIIVKAPTQERSRQTVATILDACARLLVSEGFYAMTTDKIAKEANVSIGSLYQFFGNKESVVQALVKNVIEEDKRFMTEKMRAISPLPAEQRIRAMIDTAIEITRRNPELRSKLITIQYYVSEAAFITEFINFYKEVVRHNLPQIPGRDMEKVTYVLVNSFIGMTNSMIVDNPTSTLDAELASEISQLFLKYLNLDSSVQSNPSGLNNIGQTVSPKGDYI